MKIHRVVSLTGLAAGLTAFVVVLENFEVPYDSFFWRAVQNAGHTPFFGLMALMLLAVSVLTLDRYLPNRWYHYLLAFSTTVIIGAVSEYAQIGGPRDADIWDLIRDVVGAATFLALYFVFDRGMTAVWRRRGDSTRRLVVLIAALLIMAVWTPVAVWGGAFLHRSSVFPQLIGFDSIWDRLFLAVSDARLTLVEPPTTWLDNQTPKVARVIFDVSEYPTLYLEEPYPDWTGYHAFSFSVFSENTEPVRLVVTVEDFHHNLMYDDRFNRALVIEPGVNKIAITLDDIKNAPAAHSMDMTAIRAVHLFTSGIKSPVVLYFDDFRLE